MISKTLLRLLSLMSLTIAVFCGFHVSALAQSMPNTPMAKSQQSAPPAQSLPSDQGEVTILRDQYAGKYNNSTLENLSRLYWRLGAFDLDDNLAVGNFMKINDCKIYTEYFNDDLEWKEIVNVMKGHIKEARDTYPLNYQFLLHINLGRYDPVQKGFPLINKTGFTDAKRIEVDSIDRSREICYDDAPIQDYPKSMVILLPEPFTFNFLKLDEHVAQAYILRKKAEFAKLTDDQKLRNYERDAFLRLRVTFSQYHGNLNGSNNVVMSILFGRIDGYEVFEDNEQKRLMASVSLVPEAGSNSSAAMATPQAPVAAPVGATTSTVPNTTIVPPPPTVAPALPAGNLPLVVPAK